MKKWTLLLLTVLSGIPAAQAQISFYGEWCYSNGELISKTWVSPEGARSESIDEKTGEKFIILCFLKTKKVYALFEDKKTGFLINDITKFAGTNQMVGLDLVSHEQSHTEYLGNEEVDGRMCKKYHFYRTHINNLTGEAEREGADLEWIYEPMKASNYNGCVAQKPGGQYDRLQVLRNIRQGPQPAHLFELPDGYKITEMPDGGIMELFSGKSREQNQKNFDDTQKSMKEGFEEIQKATDKSKSQEEQIKDLMKLFEGMQNKKK
ncbi:hypothetical protein NXY11_10130 [Parabacteroides faecis]|uniref:hypothetical protein n=1 Tax=Parabacteroides faecis TaxID=1217282 RepID=UPI00216411B8|nr:hypothetical protein [Parabacteroides faecis]MCS2892839.1 hypothetical protein [Parabacteroides faecis]UVQ48552.1 hypothetical protein NXY11_10130 [Parabacteroides faecis]